MGLTECRQPCQYSGTRLEGREGSRSGTQGMKGASRVQTGFLVGACLEGARALQVLIGVVEGGEGRGVWRGSALSSLYTKKSRSEGRVP